MTQEHLKRVLVTGANGYQGGAVARWLAGQGHDVRGLVRDVAKATADGGGFTPVRGDLSSAESLRAAFRGASHAVVVMPLEYDLDTVTHYARNVADAALEAGVRRIVFNTNTPVPDETTDRPGFETRRRAEEILRAGGVPVVTIRPPVYLENLFSPWNGPAIVNDGVLAYPLPAEQRVAWMSHEDLAKVAARALDADVPAGQVLHVGGADVLTGPELAAVFGQALGRAVRYLPLDVAQFEQGLAGLLGAPAAAGVAGIYHHVGGGQAPDLLAPLPAAVEEALGIQLTPTIEWVKAQPWEHWTHTGA
ncbi:NmrA family NAD(P)-binding protein [Streptomyces sp. NPDC005549]|uniref:SDR family oxidoreductase n=1 Tax=Streptomyces sp. NPDC005549 TaxID=3154888 RepID=UPI0033A7C6CF